MTLLFVILLDIGIVLVVSAYEDKSLKETFNDILNNAVRPATSSADTAQTQTQQTSGTTQTPQTPQTPQTVTL